MARFAPGYRAYRSPIPLKENEKEQKKESHAARTIFWIHNRLQEKERKKKEKKKRKRKKKQTKKSRQSRTREQDQVKKPEPPPSAKLLKAYLGQNYNKNNDF